MQDMMTLVFFLAQKAIFCDRVINLKKVNDSLLYYNTLGFKGILFNNFLINVTSIRKVI